MTIALTASPTLLTERQLRRIQRADAFAAERHAGQVLPDGAPFIGHPREVARILAEAGADEPLIVAGLLHDVLEKTATTEGELRATFGHRVADLVSSVTGDDSIGDRAERLANLRRRVAAGGPSAGLLLAADRIAKLPELQAPVDAVRAEHELASLALVEDLVPRGPLVRRLGAGLEASGVASDRLPTSRTTTEETS